MRMNCSPNLFDAHELDDNDLDVQWWTSFSGSTTHAVPDQIDVPIQEEMLPTNEPPFGEPPFGEAPFLEASTPKSNLATFEPLPRGTHTRNNTNGGFCSKEEMDSWKELRTLAWAGRSCSIGAAGASHINQCA